MDSLDRDDDSFGFPELTVTKLPIGPTNSLEFIATYRPSIGAIPQTFNLAPMWIDILLDNHPNIRGLLARQTFKTTNCANLLAKYAISYPGSEVSYCADDEEHRSTFSEQRLRYDTFLANPLLRQYLPFGRAAIRRVRLLNGTFIYLGTDENKYHYFEGKANRVMIFDEDQAQDQQYKTIAMYTLSKTHGDCWSFGIGGEAGSEYERQWQKTDQREWEYDDKTDYTDPSTKRVWPEQGWRNKLRHATNGDILNTPEELDTILKGHWIAQAPENKNYRGYHLSQEQFPHIPLTIHDAITKYNTHPELSVEYQKLHYPRNIYLSHTLARFYRAERRPITPEMVKACYDYKLYLLSPIEVQKLKSKHQQAIRVLGGVDFGSHPKASETIASIIIKWQKTGRYQLAAIRKVSDIHPGDQAMQAHYIADMFGKNQYNVDLGVGDIGYGQTQIPLIQDGGYDTKGDHITGIGKSKFKACQTYGDPTKPELQYKTEVDEKGPVKAHLRIDKTTTLQNFVDFIAWSTPAESDPFKKLTKFIIPMGKDREYETDWLLNELCNLTRKDLDPKKKDDEDDPRQKAKKEFNHPPDSVMSIIYNLVADQTYDPSAYKIGRIRK